MPKVAQPLKPVQLTKVIAAIKAQAKAGKPAVGKIAVGGEKSPGLYLRVVGDSTTWVLFYVKGTRKNGEGITVARRVSTALYDRRSSYPGVSLEEARERAAEILKGLRQGVDPVAQRRADKARDVTFKQCAEAFIEAKRAGWKNAKHAAQWENTLKTYAYPIIGSLRVADVDDTLVLQVLKQICEGESEPFWYTKTETASRLRGRIESVLDWAKASKYRDGDNPAAWHGNLEYKLPAKAQIAKVKNHDSLPYAEVGSFMAELRKREGTGARALEFAILTVARFSEVAGATWSEISEDRTEWRIPGERMKKDKDHQVPLSDDAVKLLRSLPRVEVKDGEPDYLFPGSKRGKAMSNGTLTAVLDRMGHEGLTQHGFRSTFREWAGEQTSHPREVIEHALAHKLKDKAEAAYQRGTLWPKRIRLMADWSRYCGQGAAGDGANNVVDMPQREVA